MSITALFKRLGAPLKNPMWSWGAEGAGGLIFLRVWQSEHIKVDDKVCVRLTNQALFEGQGNLGYEERKRHIARIREGAPTYCIFCEPKDRQAEPKKIKSIIDKYLYPGLSLVEHQGDVWLQLGQPVPIQPFLRIKSRVPQGVGAPMGHPDADSL